MVQINCMYCLLLKKRLLYWDMAAISDESTDKTVIVFTIFNYRLKLQSILICVYALLSGRSYIRTIFKNGFDICVIKTLASLMFSSNYHQIIVRYPSGDRQITINLSGTYNPSQIALCSVISYTEYYTL